MENTKHPLVGTWPVKRSTNAAAKALAGVGQVRIDKAGSSYSIKSLKNGTEIAHEWAIKYVSDPGNVIILGSLNAVYEFVITTSGDKNVVGVILRQGSIGDDDPGTWESELLGPDPQPSDR